MLLTSVVLLFFAYHNYQHALQGGGTIVSVFVIRFTWIKHFFFDGSDLLSLDSCSNYVMAFLMINSLFLPLCCWRFFPFLVCHVGSLFILGSLSGYFQFYSEVWGIHFFFITFLFLMCFLSVPSSPIGCLLNYLSFLHSPLSLVQLPSCHFSCFSLVLFCSQVFTSPLCRLCLTPFEIRGSLPYSYSIAHLKMILTPHWHLWILQKWTFLLLRKFYLWVTHPLTFKQKNEEKKKITDAHSLHFCYTFQPSVLLSGISFFLHLSSLQVSY